LVANHKNPHQQQVFAHWELLNQLAKRRFPERGSTAVSHLAEEALLYVLNKLEEDNWSRVRQFREQSTFPAFLKQVTQRLLEDFARQKFGRSRTPGWIKKLGPLWERVYQKLCRERLPAPMVIEDMRATLGQDSDSAALWDIVAAIRGKIIDCGALATHQTEQSSADLPESSAMNTVTDPAAQTPENRVAALQRMRLLKMIAEWLDIEPATGPVDESGDRLLATALQKLRTALPLIPEERLLLKLVFHA